VINSPVRLGRRALVLVRNRLGSAAFARLAGRNGPIPCAGVALFFATSPDNLYQFEQWRMPLEQLARQRPVFVIVDRPDTGELILQTSSLPVAYARGSAALEELVRAHDVRVVLYCNQVEPNFRMLRFAAPVHVQIGHGESDKGSSVSNQHKAYDLVFVGGDAGRDRLGAALRGFDADTRTVPIGRPQLDHPYPGAPDWPREQGWRVLYAPTWEGDRPSITYGSLVSHGETLVRALLANPDVRLVYRPHPRTGQASAAHAAADRRIRALLQAAGDRHLVDLGGYGWQWRFADACITDISAVAYDWLATGKPLVVTEPADTRVFRPPSALLDGLTLLPAGRAGDIVEVLQELRDQQVVDSMVAPGADPESLTWHYFGDTSPGASSRRFESAVEQAAALTAR
jgi:hypothetical protein